MKLQGKWSLITGASSGIGREYALQLSKKGSNIIILARREKRLQDLKAEILKKYPNCEVCIIVADLTKENESQHIFDKVSSLGKNINILINNAGLGSYSPLLESDWNSQKEMILLNVMALTELTHYFVQHMKKHGEPSYITNISSIAAYIYPPDFSTYNATKSYVKSFSLTLSEELRKTNIHVHCLSPGGVRTEFSERSGQKLSKSANMAMMESKDVVKESLENMFEKKVSSMPGLFNRFTILLSRFLPEGILIKVSSLIFGNMVKSKQKTRVIS